MQSFRRGQSLDRWLFKVFDIQVNSMVIVYVFFLEYNCYYFVHFFGNFSISLSIGLILFFFCSFANYLNITFVIYAYCSGKFYLAAILVVKIIYLVTHLKTCTS